MRETNEFGYPSCCIEFFRGGGWTTYSTKDLFKYYRSVFFTSGYVPCPGCLNKNAGKVIKQINKERDKSLPRFAGIRESVRKPIVGKFRLAIHEKKLKWRNL